MFQTLQMVFKSFFFLLCWAPYQLFYWACSANFSRTKILSSSSNFLQVLNSSINIIIYCWKDDKFRIVLFQMLKLHRWVLVDLLIWLSSLTVMIADLWESRAMVKFPPLTHLLTLKSEQQWENTFLMLSNQFSVSSLSCGNLACITYCMFKLFKILF